MLRENRKLNIHISLFNSKLGGFIPSCSVPAGITCRKSAPCLKDCYALKGNYQFPNVKQSLLDNLNEFKKDSKAFFDYIINYLNNGLVSYKFFRWFSSGDFVNYSFLCGVIRVALECPNIKFLAFTKKYELVNIYISEHPECLPENLKIVFSAWDKDFIIENPYNLPVAYVYFKDKTKNPIIPELAINCLGKCENCLSCWSLVNSQSVYFFEH